MTDPAAQSEALKNKPNLNEILLSWKGPSHPYKKRNRMYYQTLAAFTLLLVIIALFLLQDKFLIVAILSTAGVVYLISKVPPVEVEHKITPLGFDHAGQLFHWIDLHAFWFEKKWEQKVLVIQTRLNYPVQVRVVVENISEEKIQEILGKYLQHLEAPPKNVIDSLSEWIGSKIPLELSSEK